MTYSANEILTILDDGAETYEFPMLDNNYFYLGREKMHIYINETEWLIVFQELSYFIKMGSFVNSVVAFGNLIQKSGNILIKEVISESTPNKFFDLHNNFLLNPLRFEVLIKGVKKEFILSEEDYKNVKIDVGDEKMPNQAKIIRYLAYNIPDFIFFQNDEVLEICGRRDKNLNLFLDLSDWHHPDLINDEMPSELDCFQSLARAIEKNDKQLFKCPKKRHNTHWSNWEWYRRR